MTLKFCPYCGSEIREQMKFCANCGKNIQDYIPDQDANTDISQTMNGAPTQFSTAPTSNSPPIENPNVIKFASGGDRVIAFIIDSILWGIVISAIFGIDTSDPRLWSRVMEMALSFFYFWLCETVAKGQTVGKMIMNLRTVDDVTFQPVSSGRYAIHALGKACFMLIDLIIGLISKNETNPITNNYIRAMQKVSHTVVIKTK